MRARRCHRDSVQCVTTIPCSAWARPEGIVAESIVDWERNPNDSASVVEYGLTGSDCCGVIMVTTMPRRRAVRPVDPKEAALRAAGALHPHPETVRDDAFLRDPFFDPRDRVQVKYEMLRRRRVDGRPVTEIAASFSVSRQAFYEAAGAFAAAGLPGLVRKRPGPQHAHKCTDEIVDFAAQWQAGEPERSAERLATAVAQQFHVTIHPRSLTRALERRKKNDPRRRHPHDAPRQCGLRACAVRARAA